MKIRICSREGILGKTAFSFSQNETITIGRAAGVDIRIVDESVSRKHCQIEIDQGKARIRDLVSTNGTFLNGRRISKTELADGDIISLATNSFQIRLSSEPREGTAVPPLRFSDEPAERDHKITKRISIPDASSAIQHAASQADHREEVSDLNHLYNLSREIPNANDPWEMSCTLLREIFRFIDAERGFVLALDERDDVEVLCAHFRHKDYERKGLTISRTILNECIQNNEGIICHDAMNDHRFSDPDSIMGQHLKSVLYVPLLGEGKVIGAIYLDTGSVEGTFSDQEIRLIVASGQQAGADILRARLRSNLESLFIGTVRCLVAAIDAKDKYTKGHSERVTFYALSIAKEMNLSEREILEIYMAGLFHDIGRIGIDEKILNKRGGLTQAEFGQVKQHPVYSAGILRNIKNIDPIITAALHHHERFDGKGYPDGLANTEIPLPPRLLAVADAYDAMTSDRPYRKKMGRTRAIEELRNHRGTQFNPEVADTFLDALIHDKIDISQVESVLNSHQKGLHKLWG